MKGKSRRRRDDGPSPDDAPIIWPESGPLTAWWDSVMGIGRTEETEGQNAGDLSEESVSR
ncbi:hypothetical protein [Nocardia bovistercoris]|uniref:Uncharacterized protein n=1 Tax=Nocardia bovistercoris TaxID=2785916 RepID=A0A931IHV7_9NOCA|nr:hypothetical protein [Nocardia bovistercoris]MBH0781724.1 hypothetical protein [Nocardia bovistercoris]